MGPCEVDCPLSILDNARAPEDAYAYEWRQRVRRFHAAKTAKRAAIEPGMRRRSALTSRSASTRSGAPR